MYWRWIVTVAALALSYGAYMVFDCPSWSVHPTGQLICHGSETAGVAPGLGTAVWAWGASFVTLLSIWIPFFIADRKKLERSTAAFAENLHKVAIVKDETTLADDSATAPLTEAAEPDTTEPSTENESPATAVLDLVLQELSRLEGLAAEGVMSPREWVALLVEINGLHNDEVLETGTFKEINTRLINLVADPVARAEGQPDSTAQRAFVGV